MSITTKKNANIDRAAVNG